MRETDVGPEILEAHAEGHTARLYEEIRAVTGIPFVNLVYRCIATIPGGLSWTWAALRPIYESNTAAALAMAVIQNSSMPTLPQIPESYFTAAGLQANDLDEIASILDFYVRGNAMNLLAMLALCRVLDVGNYQPMALSAYPNAPDRKFSSHAIRPILQMEAMNESTRVVVTRLNKLGEGSEPDPVNPSLFRHLAHWPIFLCLAGVHLLPVEANGSITAGANAVREKAMEEVAAIVNGLKLATSSGFDPAAIVKIRAVSGHFASVTIPRLLTICVLLRRALPRAPSPTAAVGT